jgi:release factor glutamine methyltransferase
MNQLIQIAPILFPTLARNFSPVELPRWRNRIFEIYTRMRVLSPYTLECDGVKLTVLPNVYAPHFFTDSEWFASKVAEITGSQSLLEIGTGTGIIALCCGRNGGHVVATDVNPAAVENAKLNAKNVGLPINVREGDMYSPIQADERFDFIFWAHPFNNWPEPVSDMLLRSGMDYRYEGLKAYIAGAHDHLAKNGRLLLGTGDSADLKTIYDSAKKHGYRPKVLKEVEMPLAIWGDEKIRYMLLEFCRF